MRFMQKLKLLKWLPFIISSWLLTECAPKPPDVYVFESLEQYLGSDPISGHLVLKPSPACVKAIGEVECGHGVAIVSGTEIFIGELPAHLYNGKKWSELKLESVYVPAIESYAPLATYIINACKKMNCSDQVDRFKIKIDMLSTATATPPVR